MKNFEQYLTNFLYEALSESQRPWPEGKGPNRKPPKRGPGGKPIPEEKPKIKYGPGGKQIPEQKPKKEYGPPRDRSEHPAPHWRKLKLPTDDAAEGLMGLSIRKKRK